MEEKKEIIFSLQLDTDEALKRSADLRAAIDADKESLAALNKEIKAQGPATKEQLVMREQLEKRIRENTKSRSDELRSIDAYIKATKNATDENGNYNGSITQMRGALSFLTAKWNDLTKEERENAEVGGKLQKEIRRLTDELKKNGEELGDNRMNVGGYKDAILEAMRGNEKFGKSIETMGDALKVNPVGLLVTALTLLPKLFESSGDSAGLFTGIMEQGTTIINVFLDRAKFLGEAVSKLLKGDFSGAAEAAKKSYQGIGDEIKRETELTGQLAKAKYQLERDEAKNIATSKRMLNEIERLKNVRDNEFNSIQQRNDANEKAFKLEMQRQKTLEDLARRRVTIVKQEVEMRGGANKASTELIRELGEAEEALYDILEDSAGKQNELITNRYQLNQELKEQQKERAEEEKKRAEKALAEELARLEEIERKRKQELDEAIRARDELAALDKKEIDERLEMEAFLLDASIKTARINTQNEKEEADKRVAIKKAEYDAALALSNAFVALSGLIMGSSEQASDFAKAAALFQLGISTAQSLANTLEAATKAGANVAAVSGPAAPVTGPATTIGYYATGAATIFSAIAQARQIIEAQPTPKAQHFDGFGYTGDGNPTEESTAVGPKPYIYHKKELIASHASLSTPLGAIAGNILMAIMGKTARFNAPSNFNGGLYSMPSATKNMGFDGFSSIDYKTLAKEIAIANKSQPIYVIPTEIRDKANKADARKARAGIGYK